MEIERIKILAAVLELPAKQHYQFSPFGPIFEVNGLDWHCCLAGSSKTAPRIFIFSIAFVADYSYELKNSETWAPTFFKHNNSFIATVYHEKSEAAPEKLDMRVQINWLIEYISMCTVNKSVRFLISAGLNRFWLHYENTYMRGPQIKPDEFREL